MKKYAILIIINALFISSVYAHSLRIINPASRSYSCMVNDGVNDRMILFGGGSYRLEGGLYYNDVWSFDLNNEKWQSITLAPPLPSPRIMAASAYDFASTEMILFGGWAGGGAYYNDVWSLILTMGSEAWTLITPSGTPPTPRGSATAIIDQLNNRLIIFGGENGSFGYNETWSLDLSTLTWSMLSPSGTPPSPRFAHSAVYDPNAQRMIIFAGTNWGQPMYNDVWVLDLTFGNEQWQQLFPAGNQPDLRSRQFSVFNNLNNSMIIGFGYLFEFSYTFFNDVWELNMDSLVWRQMQPISYAVGRRGSCAAFDPFHQQTVIFGGDQPYGYFGDTYVLVIDTLATEENQESRVAIPPYIKISSNPTHLPCHINVFIPFPSDFCLRIFDASGRFVNTLIKDKRSSGNYIIQWDGKDSQGRKVAAGTYFIKLEIAGESVVQKAVVIE